MPKSIIKSINEPFEESLNGQLIIAGTLFCVGNVLFGIIVYVEMPVFFKIMCLLGATGCLFFTSIICMDILILN